MSEFGRFESVLLCEDVRREDNGKMFVSGIYTGDIIPFEYPATLALRLFVHYLAPKPGEQPLNFHWLFDDELVASIEGGIVQSEMDAPIGLSLPALSLTYSRPGTLRVEAEVNGARQTIITRRVVAVPPRPEVAAS